MKYRILYVEDEKILGQLVKDALIKEHYEVMQIANGAEAPGTFRTFAPHLCLLDIMLPGNDGYSVAGQIRNIDSKVPIIFLTAKVQVTDLIHGFQAGCNDYIRKPFSMDELIIRINSWLREKYGNTGTSEVNEYILGTYKFLPDKQLLVTPELTIELSFKESIILNTFCAHKNQVIARNHLMQKVWESETIYNSRSLDVYINKLRKYFIHSNIRILTLKGVGYKFITD